MTLFFSRPSTNGFHPTDTTRDPRPNEKEGEHYHFTTKEAFRDLISQGGFIEHAEFGKNFYGTSFAAVQKITDAGKTCILDIEMEGVKQLRNSHISARYLFLAPPSFEELEKRLRGRGTDSEKAVTRRLEQARREMEWAEEQPYSPTPPRT